MNYILLEDVDNEQSNFPTQLNNFKGIKTIAKKFLNNVGLFFSATVKVLNNFQNRLFPMKSLDEILTLIRMGYLRVVFFWGEGSI